MKSSQDSPSYAQFGQVHQKKVMVNGTTECHRQIYEDQQGCLPPVHKLDEIQLSNCRNKLFFRVSFIQNDARQNEKIAGHLTIHPPT